MKQEASYSKEPERAPATFLLPPPTLFLSPLAPRHYTPQEDLVLLRLSDEPLGPHSPLKEAKHVMTAACVVFSFDGLPEKLGDTTLNIHAPVPGYEEQLEKVLNRTFTSLQVSWLGGK